MSVNNVSLNSLGNILATPFMTPLSRSLIRAGWVGNIQTFSKELCEYRWPRTRDYTMAVIMLTIVVAASKADDITISARLEDRVEGRSDEKSAREDISLSNYINRKVSKHKFRELFSKVVNIKRSGDSGRIVNAISKLDRPHGWFAKCFISLAAYNYEGNMKQAEEVFKKFLKQVQKMTPWRKSNYNYLDELAVTMGKLLGAKIVNKKSGDGITGKDDNETLGETVRDKEKPHNDVSEPLDTDFKVAKERLMGLADEECLVPLPGLIFGLMRQEKPENVRRGWKLHISPQWSCAVKAFRIVLDVIKGFYCDAKCAYDLHKYITKLTGSQAGKFITIYPASDEDSNKIATMIHNEFEKQGLTGEKYFITIKNDFKVYPGIYTRLCSYKDSEDGDSRYYVGIPDRVFEKYLSEELSGKYTLQTYEHPFEKLTFNGVVLPKKVQEVDSCLMLNVISKSNWEPLTNLSQIPPDGSDIQFVTPSSRWQSGVPSDRFVAIAKVEIPKNSDPGNPDFKIILVPDDVENYYTHSAVNNPKSTKYVLRETLDLLTNLLKCLSQGKEIVRIKTVPLSDSKIPTDKNKIRFMEDPLSFLDQSKKSLESNYEVSDEVKFY